MPAKIVKMLPIDVSTLLGVDTSMVVYQGDDLRVLFGGEGGAERGGGGGRPSGGGADSTDPPAEKAPFNPVQGYAAICDGVAHPADMARVSNGIWFGELRATFDEALSDARNHEDGFANVGVYIGNVLVASP